MADMKATEVVGQLRKLVRMFEAVSVANDVIQMLAEQEQAQTKLDAELAQTSNALKSMQEALGKKDESYKELLKTVEYQSALKSTLEREYAFEKNELVAKAQKEADRIVEAAKARAAVLDESLIALNKEKEILAGQVITTKDALNTLQYMFLKEKERMKKALEI